MDGECSSAEDKLMLRGDTAGENPNELRGEIPLSCGMPAAMSTMRGVCSFLCMFDVSAWVSCIMGENRPLEDGCAGGMDEEAAAAAAAAAEDAWASRSAAAPAADGPAALPVLPATAARSILPTHSMRRVW
jgi:hypothetical protein